MCLTMIVMLEFSKDMLQHVVVALEVLNAWSSVEVYLVSLVAGMLQINQFVDFMIDGKCDKINTVLDGFNVVDPPKCV